MEHKTTLAATQQIDSGEVLEVEELLKFLHDRGDAHSNRVKRFNGLLVTTWVQKSWWQLPLFNKRRSVNASEGFAVYDVKPTPVAGYHTVKVGLDLDGALILQNTHGGIYPHFLRIAPAELRRHDYFLFQIVKQLLRDAKKAE